MTIVLILSALATAIISGTLGMGGGILLMLVMAQYFPPLLLIPLHGLVQLASNTSRTLIHFKSIRWEITGLFAFGAIVGAAVGSQFVITIPEQLFRIGIGIFILLVTFAPRPKSIPYFKGKWLLVGGGAAFISLFVGATGPLIAPFYLREGLKKEVLVSTKAACQMFVHLFKVSTFFALGFVVAPHAWLLLGMVVAVFLGNYLGKFFLHRIPERLFYLLFRILIVVLALRLIIKALI